MVRIHDRPPLIKNTQPNLGYSQVVRHQTLTLTCAGSNPATPANPFPECQSHLNDSLAQSVEHLTFNQGAMDSSSIRVTIECCPGGEMADTLDLKSNELITRAGSSPAPGTISRVYSCEMQDFFMQINLTTHPHCAWPDRTSPRNGQHEMESMALETKKLRMNLRSHVYDGSGERIRTDDLQVMSLASYHCSTPRYKH